MTGQVNDEGYAGRPHPALAPYVNRIVGYRIAGMSPGVHIGMPSSFLTLIVTLDDPVVVQTPGGPVATFAALVGGLHDRPVAIHHEGHQHGIHLDLTAAGARALFGRPAGELTQELVNLSDLLDPADRGLADQAADQPTWPAKVAVVERALLRRLDPPAVARPELGHAWDQIRRSRGTVPVWAVAAEVGWSARHLAEQFRGGVRVRGQDRRPDRPVRPVPQSGVRPTAAGRGGRALRVRRPGASEPGLAAVRRHVTGRVGADRPARILPRRPGPGRVRLRP